MGHHSQQNIFKHVLKLYCRVQEATDRILIIDGKFPMGCRLKEETLKEESR